MDLNKFIGKHNIGLRTMENDIIPMCIDMGLGVRTYHIQTKLYYIILVVIFVAKISSILTDLGSF